MKRLAAITLIGLLCYLPSCSGRQAEGEKIAVVNGAPILFKDFKKEVSLAVMRDPSFHKSPEAAEELLETMVERKLMIQEAVKKGLSEDDRFLETIKTFWEQTLIRQLINVKSKEWSDKLVVTDEEVMKYYRDMGQKVTFRTVHAGKEGDAEDIRQRLIKNEPVDKAEVIGPVLIENAGWDSPVYGAFSLEPGEVSVQKAEEGYTVVQVVKKEVFKTPGFQEVSQRIKDTLIENKKQMMMDRWLRELRKTSKVEMDAEKIKRALDELR